MFKKIRTIAVSLLAVLGLVSCQASLDGSYDYYEENTITYGTTEYTCFEFIYLTISGTEYTIQAAFSTGPSLTGGSTNGRWIKGTCSVDDSTITCAAPTSAGSMAVEFNNDDELVVASDAQETTIALTEFALPTGTWYASDFSSVWTVDTTTGSCTPVK